MSETLETLDTKPKVLVVDDERINLNALHGLLRDDYQVMVAVSGEQGLKAAVSGSPDLILLDITMPDMDGLEVCRRLKANPLTQEIPVIFITGRTQEDDEVKGFVAGAVDYIPKPFNPVIVKARVQTHARLKRQSDFLKNMAYRDGLTGIPNRRRFEAWAEDEIKRCVQLKSPLAALMIDIDHFKLYNDHYGHQQGDGCLRTVAQALQQVAQEAATGMVARYGGEEFVGLFRVANSSELQGLIEKMVDKVRSAGLPHAKSQTHDTVTISLGACFCDATEQAMLASLILQADQGLYESKSSGRNKAIWKEFSA